MENGLTDAPQLYFAHAHEDREVARPLAERLMKHGVDVWFDQWEIKIGDSLRRKMESGLSTCTHFLVLLTPQSIGKPWVETEIDAGFQKSVGREARFIGIRVGVPIQRLSPFLQTIRCPEVDLANEDQITSLIAEIHGATTKPSLGAPPAFVRKAATTGRWSDAATVVAEYLVRNSELGVKFDPQTNPAKVSCATGLPEEDARFGVLDLRDAGLIEETNETNGDSFWPTNALFVEFDSHFLGFNTERDAISVAHRLVNEKVRKVDINELAQRLDWPPRRINSALHFLQERRLIEPVHSIGSRPYAMAQLFVTDYTRRFARDNN